MNPELLSWLLKYPWDWYQRGTITLSWPVLAVLIALVALCIIALTLTGYLGPARTTNRPGIMSVLRCLLVALLLFVLAGPVLEVQVAEPVTGHIAILVDDSLSMRTPDADGNPRARGVKRLLWHEDGSLNPANNSRLNFQTYAYGEGLRPIAPDEELHFAARQSNIEAALQRIASDRDAQSLAAVILISDGGHNRSEKAGTQLQTALLQLAGASIPVHTIDVAKSGLAPDVAVQTIELPDHIISGDSFDVTIGISHNLKRPTGALLVIEDGGLILDQIPLELSGESPSLRIRHRLRLLDGGPHRLTARIEKQSGERVSENNFKERHLEVHEEPIRVLHFEGEPRYEVKFLRRAVSADPRIKLTSLIRTADNKYYRLGVTSENELVSGFPVQESDLFRFDVLVLGSAAATLLTPQQQQHIDAFVSKRGGGLILLGGRHAFAEGGYTDSPLAALMPVVLAAPEHTFQVSLKLNSTGAGRNDPLLDLTNTETLDKLLERMPPLAIVNPLRTAKPGAQVLLEALDGAGRSLIVLSRHRFGRGSVIAFAVRNSWRWQMHADIPIDDQTHETLWRQLLRDSGRHAGGRLRIQIPALLEAGALTPGQSVLVRAAVLDRNYQPLSGLPPTLSVVDPTGNLIRHTMGPAQQGFGQYQSTFVVEQAGHYEISASLGQSPDSVSQPLSAENTTVDKADAGSTVVRTHLDVTDFGDELNPDSARDGLLTRIAATSGGIAVDTENVETLIRALNQARGTQTHRQRLPLWDVPLLLFAMLLLAGAEWTIRRRRKLP